MGWWEDFKEGLSGLDPTNPNRGIGQAIDWVAEDPLVRANPVAATTALANEGLGEVGVDLSGITEPPEPPAPPDPEALADAQAEANRFDVDSPFGASTWTQDADTGKWTRTDTFSEDLQPLLQALMGESGGDLFGGGGPQFSIPTPSEIPALPEFTMPDLNFDQDIAAAEQATMDRARALLDPVFERRERRFGQEMSNMGIPMGAELYDEQLGQLRESEDEAYRRAALDSVLAGRAEHGRLADLALRESGMEWDQLTDAQKLAMLGGQQEFSQALQSQGAEFGQASGDRARKMGEILTLLGGAPTSQFSPIDIMGPAGLAYQGDLQKWQSDMVPYNSMWGALGSLPLILAMG